MPPLEIRGPVGPLEEDPDPIDRDEARGHLRLIIGNELKLARPTDSGTRGVTHATGDKDCRRQSGNRIQS